MGWEDGGNAEMGDTGGRGGERMAKEDKDKTRTIAYLFLDELSVCVHHTQAVWRLWQRQ
jgi:hypothetical protein